MPKSTLVVRATNTIGRSVDPAKIRKYFDSGVPVNTERALRSDWEKFTAFCERVDRDAIPADPETVADFLVDAADFIAANGQPLYAPASIGRWLSSINRIHVEAGWTAPGLHPTVQRVYKGICRANPRKPKRAAALFLDDLRLVLSAINRTSWPTGVPASRDYALLLMGWATASRRSELNDLNVDDVALDHERGLTIEIRRSKTDQEGLGFTKAIPAGTSPETCAPCAFAHWVDLLQAARKGQGALAAVTMNFKKDRHLCKTWKMPIDLVGAPLFPNASKTGHITSKRMSAPNINFIVERRLSEAGISPKDYSSHSMRAGFVSQAFREGATPHQIMRQTGHRNPGTLETYARETDPLRENAIVKMGL